MQDQRQFLESEITQVTIYTDRALVTREANVNIQSSESVFVFDKLPENIDKNSLQVHATGKALLMNIKLSKVFYSQIPDDKIKLLYQQRQDLEDNITDINDKIARIKKEKEFIESIAKKLTSHSKDSFTPQLDPDNWIKMVDFYRTRLGTLDQEIRITQRSLRNDTDKLEKINNDINTGSNHKKSRNQVEISVSSSEPESFELSLSYIVYGPRWEPSYDLRVDSDAKSMTIIYSGLVTQNTDECWDNVSVDLSTAQPNISGHQPVMNPWYVSKKQVELTDFLDSNMGPGGGPAASMTQMMSADTELEAAPAAMKRRSTAKPMPSATAAIETKATSVVFNIPGLHRINNDNQSHKVTVMWQEFAAHFRYSSVPKLSPYAYLKAKVSNTTEYPFLPGITNIYLDGNYVSNANLKLVAPNEEFWTYLGIDEGMKIEYKFLRRVQKEAGVFTKSNHYEYDYLIQVTNNKKSQEEIVIWDQLPITNHEKIDVKLLTPDYKQDTEKLKINEFNFIEWMHKPIPGEKIDIPFKFSIEYPKDMEIEGL